MACQMQLYIYLLPTMLIHYHYSYSAIVQPIQYHDMVIVQPTLNYIQTSPHFYQDGTTTRQIILQLQSYYIIHLHHFYSISFNHEHHKGHYPSLTFQISMQYFTHHCVYLQIHGLCSPWHSRSDSILHTIQLNANPQFVVTYNKPMLQSLHNQNHITQISQPHNFPHKSNHISMLTLHHLLGLTFLCTLMHFITSKPPLHSIFIHTQQL